MTTKTQVVKITPNIPEKLLECKNAPQPPLEGTQRDVAKFVLDLYEAHEDCKGDLSSVKSLLDAFEESKDQE